MGSSGAADDSVRATMAVSAPCVCEAGFGSVDAYGSVEAAKRLVMPDNVDTICDQVR